METVQYDYEFLDTNTIGKYWTFSFWIISDLVAQQGCCKVSVTV